MEPVTMAALIGGGASLLSGLLKSRSDSGAADANAALQREFAQQGIRWKVADAKAAGIHPLYALGASTIGASPVYAGDSGLAGGIRDMGQDVSRAILAGEDLRERQARDNAAAARLAALDQENRERSARAELREEKRLASQLQNDEVQRAYWASEVARRNQAQGPPAPPKVRDSRGQVDVGAITLKPAEQVARDPVRPSAEAGSQPMWQRRETAPGVFRDFPHPDTNLDSEIVHGLLAAQAYIDKWVSDTFFGGAPKYIQVPRKKYAPSPGAFDMDRGYQRYGVERRGR